MGKKTGSESNQLPPKRTTATVGDYQIRLTDGWTVNDGTFIQVPLNRRREKDVPHPVNADLVERCTYGLSSLQVCRDAPITPAALDVACQHIRYCLPSNIQKSVRVVPPCGPDLWSQNTERAEAVYKMMQETDELDASGTQYWLYPELKKTPWTIWPLWVEDNHGKDFVLAVVYSIQDQALRGKEGPSVPFDQVIAINVYDPRRDTWNDHGKYRTIGARQSWYRSAVLQFLGKGGYYIKEARWMHGEMSPMQLGESTSGERCFAAVKEILNKIMVLGNAYLDDRNRRTRAGIEWSLSRWVNPYQNRIEMAGICAWNLMAMFDYNARITVECVPPRAKQEVVVDGRRRLVKPEDLAGPPQHPILAELDYQISAPEGIPPLELDEMDMDDMDSDE
ncbi:uncharacterized protein F4822DRAFT_149671 [Hypoxylon trugodes]|uniref:uncharacterized protein n=1 Tax=Hypoxylon trugodes TaxID=326681 RepID=UPI00219368A5|nr:uncharacterized protein F4822DRAFT_149671 [Hypoxylon trugodes]KAI1393069.1 hypothetical protein F4822DRAFT_149671 [Hypoxylon trugodes]